MTNISSAWRRAMVWAGEPSSQRKRLGVANQTWPVAVNGCVSVRKVRVWTKSADHVCRLVWAESQLLSTAFVLAAKTVPQCTRTSARKNLNRNLALNPNRLQRARSRLRSAIEATRVRSDTIGPHADESPARTHAGFPG